MTDLNWDTIGFPAAPTRVYIDPRRILPELIRMASRRNALDRHARYRARKRLRKALEK